MTVANQVTIGRILLVPLFVVALIYHRQTGAEWHRWLALTLFLAAAISDGIDGWIARRFHQRSELGAVLDPLADKLLLVSALILLSRSDSPHLAPLPLWLAATVLSRDALLVIGLGILHYTCDKPCVRPRFSGKIATVLQMAVVVLTLLDVWPSGLWWACLAAAIFTTISGAIYIADGIRQLSASPRSGPQTN